MAMIDMYPDIQKMVEVLRDEMASRNRGVPTTSIERLAVILDPRRKDRSLCFDDEATANLAIEELTHEYNKKYGNAICKKTAVVQQHVEKHQEEPAQKKVELSLMEKRRLERVKMVMEEQQQKEASGAAVASEVERYLAQPLESDTEDFSLLTFWKEKGSAKIDPKTQGLPLSTSV